MSSVPIATCHDNREGSRQNMEPHMAETDVLLPQVKQSRSFFDRWLEYFFRLGRRKNQIGLVYPVDDDDEIRQPHIPEERRDADVLSGPHDARNGTPSPSSSKQNISSLSKNVRSEELASEHIDTSRRRGLSVQNLIPDLGRSLVQSFHDFTRIVSDTLFHGHRSRDDLPGLRTEQRDELTPEYLRVFAMTWNMNGKIPTGSDMSPLFSPTSLVHQGCHILAIGTQECERGIESSMLNSSKKGWERVLNDTFGDEYQLVKSDTLVATHLAIFVKKSIVCRVKDFKSGRIGTGIGNVMGNKGAVAISFLFDHKSVLFLNSHLAAGHTAIEERNKDYLRIRRDLVLDGTSTTKHNDITSKYEFVFWMGDMNYRINGNRGIVDKLIHSRNLEVLLHNDQLSLEMKRHHIFRGFSEAPIQFLPTYKFDTASQSTRDDSPTRSLYSPSSPKVSPHPWDDNTTADSVAAHQPLSSPDQNTKNINEETLFQYDSGPKQRVPGWTDRILFKAKHQHPPDHFYRHTSASTKKQNQNSIRSMSKKIHVLADEDGGEVSEEISHHVHGKHEIGPIIALRYDSCMEITVSDHKPVFGIYVMPAIIISWHSKDGTSIQPHPLSTSNLESSTDQQEFRNEPCQNPISSSSMPSKTACIIL